MPHFIKEFGQFLLQALLQWSNLATGGVLVALPALYYSLRQKTPPRKIVILFSSLFLIMAAFFAWRDQYQYGILEHNLRVQSDKRFEALTVPNLDATFALSSAQSSESDVRSTDVIASGRIVDHGAPTILQHWELWIKFGDKEIRQGDRLLPPPRDGKITVFPHGEGSAVVYDGIDYWPLRADSTPIPTGGAASGWIAFGFHGVSQERIWGGKAVAVLKVVDFTGKTWTFEEPFVLAQNMFDINDFGTKDSKEK